MARDCRAWRCTSGRHPAPARRRDIHYRACRLAVELDGKASHPGEQRWQDARRDNAAAADGIVTLRYGWADVTERPCETARQVATVLAGRGWRGTLRPCGPGCRS